MKKITSLQDAVQYGYNLDFGIVFEKALGNFKKIFLVAGLAYIILTVIFVALFFGFFSLIMGAVSFTESMANFATYATSSITATLIYLGITALITAIASPIAAGFLKMSYLADKDKDFSIGTIFEYYKSSHFKDILIASLIITLFSNGLAIAFEYAGLGTIGNIVSYIIAFFTFLTIPIIIFSNYSGVDAIGASVKLVLKQPLILLGLLIVAFIIVILGVIGLCIGIFFTLPFYNSITYTIYSSIVSLDEKSEIDEIGSSFDV